MELPTNTLIHWDNDLEQLIKDECEISYSYYLLHNLSFIRYSKLNNYISIPVMVIGTFTGASSVGSAALFGNTTIASIVIGLIIILLNSLQAISSYFKFSQLSEAHKIAAVSYQKVSRYLEIELALPRKERSPARVILKVLKNEIDRLMETSPIIQPVIIDQYNKKYGNEKAKKPSIVNGLKSVVVNDEVVLTGSNNSPVDNTANSLKTPGFSKTTINISEDNYINQLNAHS
jgi:hypothetical protein